MCRGSVLVSCSLVCRALLSVPMGVLARLLMCLQRFGVPCVGFSFLFARVSSKFGCTMCDFYFCVSITFSVCCVFSS